MAITGGSLLDDDDEYDKFFDPIDVEDLPYIATLPPSPERPSQPGSINNSQPQLSNSPILRPSQKATESSDEYDEYDFSEFSTTDFAKIDAEVRSAFEIVATGNSVATTDNKTSHTSNSASTNTHGGPTLVIQVEEPATKSASVRDPEPPPIIEMWKRLPLKHQAPSPYDMFKSWRGFLVVTDLVGPSWCEVQFDYSLRQKRHLKLEDRPASFLTAEGKEIAVNRKVAAENDETAQKGKEIHKELERQIHPEPVPVTVTTGEEKWGLRLVNMITSVQALLYGGLCREMPVFGILNGQIVTGIIDEVERKYASPGVKPPTTPKSHRSRNKRSHPGTPTSRVSPKKSRMSMPTSPSKPITAFFSSTSTGSLEGSAPPPLSPIFKLHLSDTKTRRYNTLPPPADTLGAHLQLMFYHRLLSRLLIPPTHSEDALDFRTLWLQLGLDHHRTFSDSFRQQLGFGNSLSSGTPGLSQGGLSTVTCLDDLTKVWRNIVESLNVAGVDETLTVVYRSQPGVMKKCKKKKRSISQLDEEADVIRAVIESLKDGVPPDETELNEAISHSLKSIPGGSRGVIPLEDPDVIEAEAERAYSEDANEAEVQWAIEQSLLAEVRNRPGLKDSLSDSDFEHVPPPSEKSKGKRKAVETVVDKPEDPVESTDDSEMGVEKTSTIIGTMSFKMDDKKLNTYLKNVLDWWHGRRPPKGVGIELTRRCLWCEYQEGCEWREKMAAAARQKLVESI